MNPKYLPTTPAGRLDRLIEEMGEVLQEIGKCRRFGFDTRWDVDRHQVAPSCAIHIPSNSENLIRELNDVIIAASGVITDLTDARYEGRDPAPMRFRTVPWQCDPNIPCGEQTLRTVPTSQRPAARRDGTLPPPAGTPLFPRVESAGLRGAAQVARDRHRSMLRSL